MFYAYPWARLPSKNILGGNRTFKVRRVCYKKLLQNKSLLLQRRRINSKGNNMPMLSICYRFVFMIDRYEYKYSRSAHFETQVATEFCYLLA